MKLHLPKALVAALSAVCTVATPLATTVGTGVLSVAGGAASAVSQVHAETSYSWNGSAIVATDSETPDEPQVVTYPEIDSGSASRGAINAPEGCDYNVNINYTNGGNLGTAVNWGTHDIKFTTGSCSEGEVTPSNGTQINGNGAITARTALFASGRYGFASADNLNSITDAVFAVGGQLWLKGEVGDGTLTTHLYIGGSNYTENNRAAGCSLRLDSGTIDNVSLVENASVCSFQNNMGSIGKIGNLSLGNCTLTMKGGGVRINGISGAGAINLQDSARMVFDAGNISEITNNITLNSGTSLGVVDGDQSNYRHTSFSNLTLAGNASLVTGHNGQYGSGIIVNGLDIMDANQSKTLTIKDEHKADNYASVVVFGKDISDATQLKGTLEINQSDDGERRKFVVIVDKEGLLENATINMSASSSSGYAALAVGSGKDGGASTVKVQGLTSNNTNTYVISYNGTDYTASLNYSTDQLLSAGGHTLEICGDDDYTFAGTVDLLVKMVGSGTQTLGNVGVNGGLSADGGTIIVNGVYSAAANTFTTARGGAISFADSASIDVSGWARSDDRDLSTDNGFLGYTYTLFDNGANISLAEGGVTLMDGTTNLGKATLSVEGNTGTLSLDKNIYNLADGTKTYSSIREEATTDDTCTLQTIRVRRDGTLSIDGTAVDLKLSPNLCQVEGSGTLEFAWSGRVHSTASSNGTISLGTAVRDFAGNVVVKNGAIVEWRDEDNKNFSSLTVENGGNFSHMKGTYTGDISIVGDGSIEKGTDYCGAMKLGSNAILAGSVYISGASASISMWGSEAATITRDIVGQEGSGSDFHFWHGNNNANPRLTVNGDLVRINSVEVSKGNVIVGGINLEGVTTFAKTGAGALTVTNATDAFFEKLDIQEGRIVLSASTLTDSGTGRIVYKGDNTNSGYKGNALGGKDLVIKGNVSYDGEFVIHSGTLALGDDIGAAPGNLNIKQITIQDGALMRIQGNGSDSRTTDIKLENGGTLYMHDSNAATNVNHFNQLIVAGAATNLEVAWKGIMRFESLTGEGKLTMKNYNTETRTVEFKQIVNFNGTVQDDMVGTFKIGHVSQDNGFSASINGDHVSSLSSDDFRKSGAGSLTMGNLTINENGTLYMTYDGTLQIGTAAGFAGLTVNDNATLKYDNASNLISLGSGNLSGVSTLTVNIDSLSSGDLCGEGGYDLGIYSGFEGNISVSGWSPDDYTLETKDGYWHLTVSTAWDPNWGVSEIAHAPVIATGTTTPASDNVYLGGTATLYISPETGSDTGSAVIFGGNEYTPYTGDSWIKVSGGTTDKLIGGNNASNWQNGAAAHFNGDSHILMEGGKTNYVIGGNFKDGYTATFTGDTYITVTGTAEVTGSIIGGSVASHKKAAPFVGNTHIFISSLLGENANTDIAGGSHPHAVIGGSLHPTNTNGLSFIGNTSVVVDLSQISGGSFFKHIIGGNMQAADGSDTDGEISHTGGDTNVSITGNPGITFAAQIVGGDWLESGLGTSSAARMTGSTHVSISGGTYSSKVIGGSYASVARSLTIGGGTNLSISDGTFSDHVVGGAYHDYDNRSTSAIGGDTNMTIQGGTFSSLVIGGSYVKRSGEVTITGGTEVNLDGGTFTAEASIYGGSYFAAGASNSTGNVKATTGNVSVVLDGATINGDLHGGSFVGAYRDNNGDDTINHEAGIDVVIKSGSVNNVYGGSVSASGTAHIEQGDVTVDLQGGTIDGNVYAAGKQSSTNSTFQTASTTVKIGSGVEFGGAGEHIVSGGYTQYGSYTGVTGTATLDLASDGGYSNLTMVKLQDFDLIKYASDATVKSIAFITTSPGTVTVQGQGETVLTVSAGLGKVSALDIEGSLALTGSIAEHGGTFTKKGSGTLTLTGGSMQMSGGTFVVEAGTVYVSGRNTSVGAGVFNKADTTLKVLGGGTLKLDFNALGWSDSGTAGSLILQGDADKGRATLDNNNAGHGSDDSEGNTMSYAINMKGYAEIKGSDTKLRLWHATIAAENLNNVISTGLIADQATSITVEEKGELEISGLLSGSQAITKDGAGKLTLSNTGNTYGGAMTISAGTLEVTGNIANASSATVSGDGILAVSGGEASVRVGGITATANSQEGGTAKNVIINASGITGATSTGDDALKVLGELSGLTLAFAAENTAAELRNVTMRDVTITDGAVSMNGVVAVASSVSGQEEAAPARMMARSLDAQTRADGTQTLTATTVKSGGSVSGDLTVDLDGSVLSPDNAGKTLVWTIFDGVSLADGESFTLKLGDVLKTIVENGLPEVTLSGEWVNNEDQSIVLKSADLLNLSTAEGGLLAAPVAGGHLVLTIDNIPEPAGSTLSLLALAALAARRRRRK